MENRNVVISAGKHAGSEAIIWDDRQGGKTVDVLLDGAIVTVRRSSLDVDDFAS